MGCAAFPGSAGSPWTKLAREACKGGVQAAALHSRGHVHVQDAKQRPNAVHGDGDPRDAQECTAYRALS